MIIKTLNSTYEVDLASERFRRTEGKNAPVGGLVENEWAPFVELRKVPTASGHVYIFFLKDGSWIRTSRIQSVTHPEEATATAAVAAAIEEIFSHEGVSE